MKFSRPKIRHLSVRMTLYYSLVIIIAFVVIVVLMSYVFSDQLLKEMDEVLNKKLSLVEATLSKKLTLVQSLYFSVLSNQVITSNIEASNNNSISIDEASANIQACLKIYINKPASVSSIIAINNHNQILQPFYACQPYADSLLGDSAYQTLKSSSITRLLSEPNSFPMSLSSEKNNLSFYGKLYNIENKYVPIGTIAINIKKSYIFSEIVSLARDTYNLCIILDQNGQVINQSGDITVDSALLKELNSDSKPSITGKYKVYEASVVTYPNWKIICLLDRHQFTAKLVELQKIVLSVSTVVLTLIIVISFYISKKITSPVNSLKAAMMQLGTGQWPGPIESSTQDEMKDLISGFNRMVLDIKALTEEIVSKQEKEKQYQVTILQSQLDLLQLQINPHFIHNTLNTMHYMALESGADELAKTITSFNALLRTSMSRSDPFITVLEEVSNIQNYLNIQQKRYDFGIKFTCHINSDVSFALVPKLILQPLIENSLFHGIVPKKGGTISAEFRSIDHQLYITISDDGIGIPKDYLEQLIAGRFNNPKSYNRIGIKNVNERLILLYGEESALQFFSDDKNGTRVQFQIPLASSF